MEEGERNTVSTESQAARHIYHAEKLYGRTLGSELLFLRSPFLANPSSSVANVLLAVLPFLPSTPVAPCVAAAPVADPPVDLRLDPLAAAVDALDIEADLEWVGSTSDSSDELDSNVSSGECDLMVPAAVDPDETCLVGGSMLAGAADMAWCVNDDDDEGWLKAWRGGKPSDWCCWVEPVPG